MLFERLLAKLDWVLPADLRAAPTDTLRRARLAVFFPALMIAPGPVFSVLFLAQGHVSLALQCLLLDSLVAVSFAILRITASIRAAILYFALTYVAMLVVIFLSPGGGGASSAGIVWMATAPVIALLVDGRTAGRVVLVATLGAVAFLVWRSTGDDLDGNATSTMRAIGASGAEAIVTGAVNDVLIMFAFYGLATVFESAQRRAHGEVTARERDVRLLLDHTGQGFMTIRRDGAIFGAQSQALRAWFGEPKPKDTLARYLGRVDESTGARFHLMSEALVDAFLPDEVVLDQVPRRLRLADGRILSFDVSPIADTADLLVVVSDVTAEVARERTEAVQREMAAVTERALRDPRGLRLLVTEADRAIAALERGACDGRETLRLVHTLKGNMSLFGVATVAELCHELEEKLAERAEEDRALTQEELGDLGAAYRAFRERADILVHGDPSSLSVPRKAIQSLCSRIEHRAPPQELLGVIASWDEEPVEQSFSRLGTQARALAQRLGKGEIILDIDSGDVTLPEERFAPLWAAAVHLVRNAVDHGIEPPATRAAHGKPARGTIRMRASTANGVVSIQVGDDGAGIDWPAVAKRAQAKGLRAATHQDLVHALFVDGVTTRDRASEVSGRGVGLAAVAAAVADLGGEIDVRSGAAGTTFHMSFRASEPPRRSAVVASAA